MKSEPMTIFGDGEQQRAFTHIRDVAPIIASCVDVPGARNQVFNVGADVPHTVNYLARIVADAMGRDCRTVHLEPRNEVKVAFSDHSLADGVFGARDKMSLEEGIGQMAAWVRDHGSRESNIFEDIEIPKNLPPSWARVARVRV
jgi:UDP-glucose 4-epimerase